MHSLQGQFLIASTHLLDPNFSRAVVLIVQHGDEGALGLVLNRPLEATVREACEQVLDESCDVQGVLYQGGPCEGPLMVVHTDADYGEVEILPGLHFTTERQKIEWLLRHDGSESESKFFVGYSGWGAGQLEGEMETGSWLVLPAEAKAVFRYDDKQWTKLFTTATLGKWIKPEHMPDDPSMN